MSVPTRDLERAVAFYGEALGLRRSMYRPVANFAEFETGTVTLSVVDPQKMGIGSLHANANHLALQVADVAAARAELEERGVTFDGTSWTRACVTWRSSTIPTATRSCSTTATRRALPKPDARARRRGRPSASLTPPARPCRVGHRRP